MKSESGPDIPEQDILNLIDKISKQTGVNRADIVDYAKVSLYVAGVRFACHLRSIGWTHEAVMASHQEWSQRNKRESQQAAHKIPHTKRLV